MTKLLGHGRHSWRIASIAAMQKEISQPTLGNFANYSRDTPASIPILIRDADLFRGPHRMATD